MDTGADAGDWAPVLVTGLGSSAGDWAQRMNYLDWGFTSKNSNPHQLLVTRVDG